MKSFITTRNPFTNSELEHYPLMESQEVEHVIAAAHLAQRKWRQSQLQERSAALERLAQGLEAQQERLAGLMVAEMGKPIRQARAEIMKCAGCCRFYATSLEIFLAPLPVSTEAQKSYVSYQPLGVILAVMPWNFPFWQAIRAVVPALAAGNAILLKHASNTTGCALALEGLIHEAFGSTVLMRSLVVGHDKVAALIADSRIRGVTLTGSTPVGREIAGRAGQALKKCVLELGGSDPYVVLGDVDVAQVASACAEARLINSGQSCIAAKRFIVRDSIADQFVDLFCAHLKSKKVGDPASEQTDIGPMARHDLRDELHTQVERSIQQGSHLVMGGKIESHVGAFYGPTVLTHVRSGQVAYHDELFGPVASILIAQSDEEAIALANDTSFGLGAAIWTSDIGRGEQLAREEMEVGCCFVNESVRSDVRLPFGGVKDSGYGRELSHFGLHEFTNTKTIYVK